MAYLSLYRKYRPNTFAEVVGQRHVITALQNAIRDDSLHHAYLFAGPRGTGKTTIARILAMAVNAEEGPTPEPDPESRVSRSIREGHAVDVVELDMASHGGVDDARELRDRAVYAPAELRKKVYILDEVHMASQAAFNALLKLIEEPPEHVLFAMATTDPQKVLPTILSRVQRLDLRRVAAGELGEHVRRLGGLEGFTIDDGALSLVLRAGDGSVRDTLSVLEQVLAYAGGKITVEAAAEVLGRTPVERTLEAVELIAAGDVAGLFALVHRLLDDGVDLRRYTIDLVHHLRDVLIVTVAPGRDDLLDTTVEQRALVVGQVGLLTKERLIAATDLLGQVLIEQRQAGAARLPLELALAKLAVPEAAGDVTALADRVARLESGAVVAGAATAPSASEPTGRAAARAAAARTATSTQPADVGAATDPAAIGAEPLAAADDAVAETVDTTTSPQADQASPAPADPPAAEPATPVDTPAPGPTAPDEPAVGTGPGDEPTEPTADGAAGDGDAGDAGDGDGDAVAQAPARSSVPAGDAPTAEEPAGDGVAPPAEERFAVLEAKWPTILEALRDRKRKAFAMYQPATPIAYDKGVLSLDYPPKYTKFHAKEALSGDLLGLFQETVLEVTGIRVRVETVTGGKVQRAPQPPEMASAGEPLNAPGRPPGPTAVDRPQPAHVAASATPTAEPQAPPPDAPAADDDADPERAPRTSAPSEPTQPAGGSTRGAGVAAEPTTSDGAVDEAGLVAEAEAVGGGLSLDEAARNVVEVLDATELDTTEV